MSEQVCLIDFSGATSPSPSVMSSPYNSQCCDSCGKEDEPHNLKSYCNCIRKYHEDCFNENRRCAHFLFFVMEHSMWCHECGYIYRWRNSKEGMNFLERGLIRITIQFALYFNLFSLVTYLLAIATFFLQWHSDLFFVVFLWIFIPARFIEKQLFKLAGCLCVKFQRNKFAPREAQDPPLEFPSDVLLAVKLVNEKGIIAHEKIMSDISGINYDGDASSDHENDTLPSFEEEERYWTEMFRHRNPVTVTAGTASGTSN